MDNRKAYLEQRANIHIKPEIGKPSGNDLGAAVMSILAHLGNENTRTATFLFREFLYRDGAKSSAKHEVKQCA